MPQRKKLLKTNDQETEMVLLKTVLEEETGCGHEWSVEHDKFYLRLGGDPRLVHSWPCPAWVVLHPEDHEQFTEEARAVLYPKTRVVLYPKTRVVLYPKSRRVR